MFIGTAGAAFAQEAKVISLEQVPGKFDKKELSLEAGQPYVFEIHNKGVDHKVGFVLAPKGEDR